MTQAGQKLLVLDLDETLIHANTQLLKAKPDFKLQDYYIYKRPGLMSFLEECNQLYALAIWSSADDNYAKIIAQEIIPKHIHLEFVWGRSECWVKIARIEDEALGIVRREYQNIKPLEKIRRKEHTIQDIFIVDDSLFKVKDNENNYYIIPPFLGDSDDDELGKVMQFLRNTF